MRLHEEKRGILKRSGKEERVKNWYNYFKEILRKKSKTTYENELKATVINETDTCFQTGPFKNDGYESVRN